MDDSDVLERGAACVGGNTTAIGFGLAANATNVFAANFDAIPSYSSGDCTYLDRDASGNFSRWDIRLSFCAAGSAVYAAGTLADLGDADLANATTAAFGAGVVFRFWDNQPNGIVDANDRVYIAATTQAAAVRFPATGDIRLHGSAGQFGSMVALGDRDFGPILLAIPAGPSFCRVNLGDQALVTDDGYYFNWRAAGAGGSPVVNNDMRLVPVLGKTAGSLVGDNDTVERVACVGGATTAIGFGLAGGATNVFALNFDQVVGYTAGDCVYLDRDSSGTMSRWDIRTSACNVGSNTYAAGTLVELGDTDLVNAPGAAAFGAAVSFRFWDNQPNGIVDGGDRIYLAFTTFAALPAATDRVPTVNDVRFAGGVGQYGSRVKFGDNDMIPTLAVLPAAGGVVSVCRVNLGDQSLVTDDGYYLFGAAAGTTPVANNALRIVSILGQAAGTLVGDADFAEHAPCTNPATGAAGSGPVAFGAAAGAPNIFAQNFDQIAGYTSGDCVYLDRDGSATLTRWDVRMTACRVGSNTYNAGTLVELGDTDLVNIPGFASFNAGGGGPVVWRSWDSQPNAVLDAGDRLYIALTSTGAAGLFPTVNDVRLFGNRTSAINQTPTPPPTPTPTPTPPPGPHLTVSVDPVPMQECVSGGSWVMLVGHARNASGPLRIYWFTDNRNVTVTDASLEVLVFFPVGNTTVALVVTDDFHTAAALAYVNVTDSYFPSTTARVHGTPGNAGWWRSVVDVDLNASDLCGVRTTFYRVGNGSFSEGDRVTLRDGRHNITFASVDLVNHLEPMQSITVNVDATPPRTTARLNGTLGNHGWWRSSVAVTLNATDALSGLANTHVALDGGPFVPGTFLLVQGDGVHTVQFYSEDIAGNLEARETLTVRIDATAPSARITDPARGAAYVLDQRLPLPELPFTVVVGDKTVRGAANESTSGLERVEFWVDGRLEATDVEPRMFNSPQAFAWAVNRAPAGTHQLEFRAWDLAGNEGRSANVNVTSLPLGPDGLLRASAECSQLLPLDLCDALAREQPPPVREGLAEAPRLALGPRPDDGRGS